MDIKQNYIYRFEYNINEFESLDENNFLKSI